jgi:hypothetical protein
MTEKALENLALEKESIQIDLMYQNLRTQGDAPENVRRSQWQV